MKPRSPLERLVRALVAWGMSVCAVSGFLGLRALAWRQDHLVMSMILSGAVISLVVAGIVAILYVILGRWLMRFIALDWMGVRLGALIGAFLYGGYHALVPLTAAYAAEPIPLRMIQGGIDGAVIGAGFGLVTTFVSGRAISFDNAGLIRFAMLYGVILLVAGVLVLVDATLRFPAVAVLILAVPPMLVLRIAVGALDRRADHLARL